jgi:hypothetical protein
MMQMQTLINQEVFKAPGTKKMVVILVSMATIYQNKNETETSLIKID